jgi:hypothetical protein
MNLNARTSLLKMQKESIVCKKEIYSIVLNFVDDIQDVLNCCYH